MPNEEEPLGPKKTALVLVIVVGCFAVLWPKIIYPMFAGNVNDQIQPNKFDKAAGIKQERSTHPRMPMVPPAVLRERGKNSLPSPIIPPAVPKPQVLNHRPEPLPLHAARMRPPLGAGGGGAMPQPRSTTTGVLLPLYAIGICIFFVYTLFKILLKRGDEAAPQAHGFQPEPAFRRRVFECKHERDPRYQVDAPLVFNAISGLVAEVQQQMEESYVATARRGQNQKKEEESTASSAPENNESTPVMTPGDKVEIREMNSFQHAPELKGENEYHADDIDIDHGSSAKIEQNDHSLQEKLGGVLDNISTNKSVYDIVDEVDINHDLNLKEDEKVSTINEKLDDLIASISQEKSLDDFNYDIYNIKSNGVDNTSEEESSPEEAVADKSTSGKILDDILTPELRGELHREILPEQEEVKEEVNWIYLEGEIPSQTCLLVSDAQTSQDDAVIVTSKVTLSLINKQDLDDEYATADAMTSPKENEDQEEEELEEEMTEEIEEEEVEIEEIDEELPEDTDSEHQKNPT